MPLDLSPALASAGPPTSRALHIAIVGATGAVGAELLGCLDRSSLTIASLRLLASPRSAGRRLEFRGEALAVEALDTHSFDGIDLALFSAGAAASHEWGPRAVAAGAVVVDNSSAFRMDPAVPLVVPEVNGGEIARHRGIIANPNCVAIIATVPLAPLHRRFRIRRITAATYQAASGAGAAAMAELRASTVAHLAGEAYVPTVLRHPYAFNLFSHDTPVDPDSGENGEEMKVVREIRKLLAEPRLAIGITCVRVPVLRAHAIALTVEFAEPTSPDAVRDILARAPGVRVIDDRAANRFPMPSEAQGQGDVLVGRIRRDGGDASGRSIAMFLAGDQLMKGAALNAVQIAERLTTGS